jgi:son of sevenless
MEENIKPQDYYIKSIKELQINYKKYEQEEKDNIKYTESKEIEVASIKKIIEELTSHNRFDSNLLQQFMLTFRSFTNIKEIFELLEERFNFPPPEECITNEDFLEFKKIYLDSIRLRIVQMVKYWLENFYRLDFNEKEAMDHLFNFLEMMEKSKGESFAKKLKMTVNLQKKELYLEEMKKTDINNTSEVQKLTNTPKILLPRRKTILLKKKDFLEKILNWPPLEISRQISLIEFEMFEKIEPKECLNQSWNKGISYIFINQENRKTKAPNISSLITWFNNLSKWVGTTIVKLTDENERVNAIKIFISIANSLKEINNFNGLFSIISGLSLAPIFRLKKTWEKLDKESKQTHQDLIQFTSNEKSFKTLRNYVRVQTPPLLPYIGLYLTDLTFIEDGNPKYIDGLINFEKCRLFSNMIRNLQLYQNLRFNFEKCTDLYQLLKDIKSLEDDEMYEESLKIEGKISTKKKKNLNEIKIDEKKFDGNKINEKIDMNSNEFLNNWNNFILTETGKNWVKLENNNQIYFGNKSQKITQWKIPNDYFDFISNSNPNSSWRIYYSNEGEKYYYNILTLKSQWDKPDDF